MQRSHRDPKLVRFLGARSWAGIGVIAAIAIAAVQWEPLADFVCGLIGESRLVRDGEAILIATADDLPHSQAIVGDTIRIDSAISVDRSVYVVANDLKFGPSGSIRASEVTIFATSVTGGSLDVSGADVTTLGGNGSDGGTIFIASGRVNGTRIDAVGGRGGKGEDGASGVDGQDGKCGASIPLLNIDNWRGSKPGSDGVDGGDGGAGGRGGAVTILVSESGSFPEPNVPGGKGGMGGHGGSGGKGGAGCFGEGGNQPRRSDGNDGGAGDPGPDGAKGATVIREIDFGMVGRVLEGAVLTDPRVLAEAMQKLVEGPK